MLYGRVLGLALCAVASSASVALAQGLPIAAVPVSYSPQSPILVPDTSEAITSGEPTAQTAPSQSPVPGDPAEPPTLTLVLVGDTGFNASDETVTAAGARRHGTVTPWPHLTRHIAHLIDGDLNFANLETVVTDDNGLKAVDKAFNFRTHPDAVAHLSRLGFNLISAANNHAVDYGLAGARSTIEHLDRLAAKTDLTYAGLGLDRERAISPRIVAKQGYRVAFSALGIGAGQLAAGEGPRQAAYGSAADFSDALRQSAETGAAYRILSVHYGLERNVRPLETDARKLRDEAVRGSGIDLVVGHHAHVAAGVQRVGGKLIVYGLGNFLHPGMQDMARFGMCQDFGLMLRIHAIPAANGRLEAAAVEAIPLTRMHMDAQPLLAAPARERIGVLNILAEGLDEGSDAVGVRFSAMPDGRGLFCTPAAGNRSDKVGRLCREYTAPEPLAADLRRRIHAACGAGVMASRRVLDSAPSRRAAAVTATGTTLAAVAPEERP